MGRRSLTEERTPEILEAFARSIIRYGLDVSLEQVAEEAGMTRSIIRHYIGNRDQVVTTLMENIAQDYIQELQEASAEIAPENMIEETLDYLFEGEPGYDDYDKLIFSVLMTARDRYPDAKRILLNMVDRLIGMFARDLNQAYPHAQPSQCEAVAYSIIALAMSNESFLWLGIDTAYNATARRSAEVLVASLSDTAPPASTSAS